MTAVPMLDQSTVYHARAGQQARRFPMNMPLRDRLLLSAKEDSLGCWNWTRARVRSDLYGVIGWHGRQVYAHRAAYTEFVGPIPAGMWIDHLCLNKGCINPAHLEVVSPRENGARAMWIGHPHDNSPKTCKRGHDWSVTPPNISTRANGQIKRDCAECVSVRRGRAA